MSGTRNKDNGFLFKKRELIAFVIVVIFILLFLFLFLSRDILDRAKKEDKCIELTLFYLENIVRIDPKNYEAKMILAQKYIDHGDFAKAEKLIGDIERSDIKELREKAIFLRYNLVKKRVFSFPEGSKERETALGEIEKLLRKMVLLNKEAKLLTYLYNESISMNLPELAFSVVKKGLTLEDLEDKERIYWLKKGYKVALMTSRHEGALKYAEELSELDTENRSVWLSKAGDIALSVGRYKESSDFYLMALKEENDKQRRKELINKAVKSLLAGEKHVEAVNIIRKFYSEFINDVDTTKFFIQTALAANDITLSREISIKAMEVLF